MGIYLNPGNENFSDTLKRPIYVDKTEMISVINKFIATDNKYICVSRPRRFGKTIAGNMLTAYYSKGCDSRELFSPYKIYIVFSLIPYKKPMNNIGFFIILF
ncbi:MAG: AAA family ATPase [Treponema sp.]|nr:AAA family ATPase [Treponema sp.]